MKSRADVRCQNEDPRLEKAMIIQADMVSSKSDACRVSFQPLFP